MSQSPVLAPQSTSTSDRLPDQIGLLLVLAVSIWIALISAGAHAITWTAEQVMLLMGLDLPGIVWPLVSVAQSLMIAIPTVLLALLWPGERYRAVFRTWAIAAAYILILAPVRLIQPPATQLANVLQILLTVLALGLLILLERNKVADLQWKIGARTASPILALTVAAIVIYPWLAWGALGSPLDSILSLIAGLVFGFTAAFLLSNTLFIPLRRTSTGIGRDLLLGGLGAGTALLAMVTAFGFNGAQILLMFAVPALCIAVTGIGWFGQNRSEETNWLAIALLLGLVTAAPMMFVDPDELNLFLVFGTKDIPYWASAAALFSMLIAVTFDALTLMVRRHLTGSKTRAPLYIALVSFWCMGALIYFAIGQPGFFGDQLFVILKDQADLAGLTDGIEAGRKPEFVYRELVGQARESQADIRDTLDRLGLDYTAYYLVNALAVDGGPFVRWWLRSRADVNRVIDNPILRPVPGSAGNPTGDSMPPLKSLWNLNLIGVDRVWNEFGVNGEGIVIGHTDTGVQSDHPELADSYRGYGGSDDYNWFDPWNQSNSPIDSGGHGTHTLGTIVGNRTGVAPGAEWFACANLVRGLADPATYLDCLQFMLAPFPMGGDPFTDGDPSLSANIVNNSWLCPEIEGCDEWTMIEAARAMRQAGILMVVSAGNEGPFCSSIQFPLSTFDEVLSVGAINQTGELASFSSLGPVTADDSERIKPDLVAPGVGILSSFPNNSYEILAGTSMAGPHVAGVVALMWSVNPSLVGDIERTEQILTSTALSYNGPLPDCVDGSKRPNNGVGYGLVNAYQAVKTAWDLGDQEANITPAGD